MKVYVAMHWYKKISKKYLYFFFKYHSKAQRYALTKDEENWSFMVPLTDQEYKTLTVRQVLVRCSKKLEAFPVKDMKMFDIKTRTKSSLLPFESKVSADCPMKDIYVNKKSESALNISINRIFKKNITVYTPNPDQEIISFDNLIKAESNFPLNINNFFFLKKMLTEFNKMDKNIRVSPSSYSLIIFDLTNGMYYKTLPKNDFVPFLRKKFIYLIMENSKISKIKSLMNTDVQPELPKIDDSQKTQVQEQSEQEQPAPVSEEVKKQNEEESSTGSGPVPPPPPPPPPPKKDKPTVSAPKKGSLPSNDEESFKERLEKARAKLKKVNQDDDLLIDLEVIETDDAQNPFHIKGINGETVSYVKNASSTEEAIEKIKSKNLILDLPGNSPNIIKSQIESKIDSNIFEKCCKKFSSGSELIIVNIKGTNGKTVSLEGKPTMGNFSALETMGLIEKTEKKPSKSGKGDLASMLKDAAEARNTSEGEDKEEVVENDDNW